jgi:hypothetical protein
VAVVGNEDGAHAVTADMAEALNDVKFPVPAKPGTFRVGEALDTADYQDFEQAPGRSGSPRPVRRAALPISCGRCALSPTWPTALGADGRTSELDRRLLSARPDQAPSPPQLGPSADTELGVTVPLLGRTKGLTGEAVTLRV